MQKINIYNTKTKKKEVFVPLDKNNIGMYVCGPTVYDYAHIGNARPVVVFDLLYRILRNHYGDNKVTYVRNITDVDDKIMDRAKRDNIDIDVLTKQTTEYFHEDTDALGVLRPNHEPRATEYIDQMIDMIKELVSKDHAYEADNHVLFDTKSFDDYGKLSKRNLDDMIAGARVEVAPFKKNPTDFVLWKPSDKDQVGWESPWGFGRPGWHIECSAMSKSLLGKSFDIHGGGIDLVFPHHENEIAQSCCANDAPYANIWMHNGFLQINGQKMSKSLGNFFTIRELLEEKKISGAVIRLLLLRTHYRQPLDWNDEGVKECENILKKWFRVAGDYPDAKPYLPDDVRDALYDDLNMPEAISIMHKLSPEELASCLKFLGFEQKVNITLSDNEIEELIQKRNSARKNKDFALSDSIRDKLFENGIEIEDTRDGTKWRRG